MRICKKKRNFMNIKKLEIETPLKMFSQYHHGKKAFLDYFGKGLEGQSGRDDSKQTFFYSALFSFLQNPHNPLASSSCSGSEKAF